MRVPLQTRPGGGGRVSGGGIWLGTTDIASRGVSLETHILLSILRCPSVLWRSKAQEEIVKEHLPRCWRREQRQSGEVPLEDETLRYKGLQFSISISRRLPEEHCCSCTREADRFAAMLCRISRY